MRPRDRILSNLESTYREAFEAAKARDDQVEMARLDFEFQRDQIHLEVLLDLRTLLAERPALTAGAPGPTAAGTGTEGPKSEGKKERSLLDEGAALIEKAEALKRIVRLR